MYGVERLSGLPQAQGFCHGTRGASADPTPLRRDQASRRLVGAARGGLPHPLRVRGLCDVGCPPRPALYVWPLSLALLLARAVRGLAPRLVRAEAGVVARLARVFPGPADPPVPGPLPAHLLLLPRRLLQGVLGGPARLCRR